MVYIHSYENNNYRKTIWVYGLVKNSLQIAFACNYSIQGDAVYAKSLAEQTIQLQIELFINICGETFPVSCHVELITK